MKSSPGISGQRQNKILCKFLMYKKIANFPNTRFSSHYEILNSARPWCQILDLIYTNQKIIYSKQFSSQNTPKINKKQPKIINDFQQNSKRMICRGFSAPPPTVDDDDDDGELLWCLTFAIFYFFAFPLMSIWTKVEKSSTLNEHFFQKFGIQCKHTHTRTMEISGI